MTTTHLRAVVPALLLLLSLAACAAMPTDMQSKSVHSKRMPSTSMPSTSAHATGTTASFVVVRHAEKADDGSPDPPLSAAGVARARRLAAALHAEPVIAVYATPYRRTQQTAVATAGDHRLAVTAYAANQPAAELAAQLRNRHAHGTVLVVGHSNTAPGIAAALCGCIATPLGDHDYGRVYRIDIGAGGRALLEETILR